MRVVWHGEYVRYFEDGREAFGEQYPGLGYLDIYNSGYTTPIVEMHVEYKLPLRIAERAVVETRYLPLLPKSVSNTQSAVSRIRPWSQQVLRCRCL